MYDKNSKISSKKYEIVSLGTNCLPRTILTRNNVKPSKADGELSGPFDLVYHKPQRILYYIKNNFENYFDDIFFVLVKRNFLDFRKKGLWQKKDGTRFFHDKDCYSTDKTKLVERISRRIDNFNTILESNLPKVFVMSLFDDFDGIEELFDILKAKSNGNIVLIVLGFGLTPQHYSKGIYVLNLEPPIDKYISKWNIKKVVNSQSGKYIEKCICQYVRRVIDSEIENLNK